MEAINNKAMQNSGTKIENCNTELIYGAIEATKLVDYFLTHQSHENKKNKIKYIQDKSNDVKLYKHKINHSNNYYRNRSLSENSTYYKKFRNEGYTKPRQSSEPICYDSSSITSSEEAKISTTPITLNQETEHEICLNYVAINNNNCSKDSVEKGEQESDKQVEVPVDDLDHNLKVLEEIAEQNCLQEPQKQEEFKTRSSSVSSSLSESSSSSTHNLVIDQTIEKQSEKIPTLTSTLKRSSSKELDCHVHKLPKLSLNESVTTINTAATPTATSPLNAQLDATTIVNSNSKIQNTTQVPPK